MKQLRCRFVLSLLSSGLLLVWLAKTDTVGIAFGQPQAARGQSIGAASDARMPVLVELFTSEGCSSCPPADALLARLARTQPVAEAHVIALEHHVDYWDQLGWRDPFSSAAATARQEEYAVSFGNNGPYTPQMVVDGTAEFVGNDEGAARRAIDRAARATKAAIELQWSRSNAARTALREPLEIRINSLAAASKNDAAEVFLAITEDNLHSSVARGENAGRALEHACVVRRLERVGKLDAAGNTAFTAHPLLRIETGWKRPDLRAAVFVQEAKSRRVLAAASLPLPPQ
jgi:hypothetical protein